MKIMLAAVFAVFLAGCHTIDDSKYEKLYSENLIKLAELESEPAKDDSVYIELKKAGPESAAPGAGILEDSEIKDILKAEREPEEKSDRSGELKSALARQGEKLSGGLKIKSENLKYNRESAIADFLGGVTLYSDGIIVKADRLRSRDYRDNAVATGNVAGFYQEQDIIIYSEIMEYTDGMNVVAARGSVVVEKDTGSRGTIKMKADKVIFDAKKGDIRAVKAVSYTHLTLPTKRIV